MTEYSFEILKYIGKFHPLVLHLPIGSLLMTFLLWVASKFQKTNMEKAIQMGLDFSFVGALVASLMGYFLSLDDAYTFEALKTHFWGGIITLVLSFVLSVLHRSKSHNTLFFGSFLMTLIALTITGHQGAKITHGDDYLAMPSIDETTPTLALKDSIDYYREVVQVIFEDKCVSCHNANKSKSGLRLDGRDWVMKGGERGSLFDPQDPQKGRLVQYIHLPLDDELHMPPKNKAQLTQEEKWLISHWVLSGNYLNDKAISIAINDSLKNRILSFVGADKPIQPARGNDLAKLLAIGFRIKPNALSDNMLKVKFMKSRLNADHLEALSRIKHQLIELDVSNTNFNDEMARILVDFPRLKVLRLDQTSIGDTTLEHLQNTTLEVLNLCHTKVSQRGVEKLLKNAPPKTIYAWNTTIKKDQQKQLASIAPSMIHFGTADLFADKLSLSIPELLNTNTIFDDTIALRFEEPQVKNIKIHYTLDGSEPDKNAPVYQGSIVLNASKLLKAKSIKAGWEDSELLEQMIYKDNHHVVEYLLHSPLGEQYSISHHVNFTFKDNENVLFDRKKGARVYRGTSIEEGKTWLGVLEKDFEIDVKLKQTKNIKKVTLSMLENHDMKALFPKKIEIYGKTPSGTYELLNAMSIPILVEPDERISYFKDFTLDVDLDDYQEVKVIAQNHKLFPDAPVYRKAKNRKTWLFIDEVIFW